MIQKLTTCMIRIVKFVVGTNKTVLYTLTNMKSQWATVHTSGQVKQPQYCLLQTDGEVP